jgi:hypothetical protein
MLVRNFHERLVVRCVNAVGSGSKLKHGEVYIVHKVLPPDAEISNWCKLVLMGIDGVFISSRFIGTDITAPYPRVCAIGSTSGITSHVKPHPIFPGAWVNA